MSEQPAIADRIHDLCARHDILVLIENYARGLDRLLPELQRNVFQEDAVVEAGVFQGGPDAFVKFCQDLLGGMARTHHQIGQARLDIDGTIATGEVYFTAYHRASTDGMPQDLFIAGRYLDRYEKHSGGCKIAARKIVVDWKRTEAVPVDDAASWQGMIRGGRGERG